MTRIGVVILLWSSLCFTSCIDKKTEENKPEATSTILPSSTGKVSEIVVVISNDLWEGEVGAILKSSFQENIPALPQQEAYFDLYAIEAKDFSTIFKTHKNILWLSLTEPTFEKKEQKWAKNQLFVQVSDKNEANLAKNLNNRIHQIRAWFLAKDQLRRIEKLKSGSEKDIEKQINEQFNISTIIPKGYKSAVVQNDFIWLRKDHPEINVVSNLWISYKDYSHPKQFKKPELIQLRDSIGKLHVEGTPSQSFMATELLYNPDYKLLKDQPYTIETRGLWTMVNDFLGGPYVAYAILDEKKQKIIYAEGFVYCPGERKREYIADLEAVLSSISIN